MNLFELFVKIGVDDQASGNIEKITQKIGSGLQAAAKIGVAAISAASTGIVALTKKAVDNYAEYEQLVGGVETLFKNSADTVMQYADNAYKTAGLSANEYMETVTSFSASLLQSLDGDTAEATEYANRAITDMADNANKMGTSISMIQNAYQGFAKKNYTMLDNLKLGYGGTQAEMYRLMQDAEKLGAVFNSEYYLTEKGSLIADFADITTAIHVVQTEMGITGTTALEAEKTISGSVASMKSAWSNLITGIANDNADFGRLIDEMVSSVEIAASNIIPRITKSLEGIADLISGIAPIVIDKLPSLTESLVPQLINTATSMVNSVVKVLPDLLQTVVDALISNAPTLISAAVSLLNTLISSFSENYDIVVQSAIDIVVQLSEGILSMLPQIIQLGLDIIVSLAMGIADAIKNDDFIGTIVDVVLQIVDTLTNPDTLKNLLNAAFTLIEALVIGIIENLPALIEAAIQIVLNLIDFITDADNIEKLLQMTVTLIEKISDGLINAIPQLVDAAIQIITKLCEFFLEPENIKMLLDMSFEIVLAIVKGLLNAVTELTKGVGKLIETVINQFGETNWGGVGQSIIDSLLGGFKSAWEIVKTWFNGAVENIKQVIQGITEAINGVMGKKAEMEAGINPSMQSIIDRDRALENSNSTPTADNFGGYNVSPNVSVTQNIYSSAKTPSELLDEAMYQQERAAFVGV